MTHLLDPESAAARDQALKPADRQQEVRRLTALATEPARGQDEDVPVDLRKYWDILLRRKWIVLVTTVIAVMAGLVVTYNTTPIYRSTASLQVEEPTFRLRGFEREVGLGGGESYTKARRYQKTQEDVLRSRALAERVVDQLGLAAGRRQPTKRTPSLLREWKNTFKAWIKGTDKTRTRDESVKKPANLRSNLARAIQAGLLVVSDKKSQVLRISYISSNPETAASIANAFAENYIAMNIERRFGTTVHAEQFLTERIEQARANLEDSEKELVAYAKEHELVDPEDRLGTLMQTLKALSQELTRVEAERIAAKSEYDQAVKDRGSTAAQVMTDPIIQALKARKGELELEYQGLPAIYKANYPAKRQLRRQISEIAQQIKAENAAAIKKFEANLKAALQEQASLLAAKDQEQRALEARIEEVKGEILKLRDRTTDFQVLKREVDTNRGIYNNLLQRVKEVGVLSAGTNNNITIIDRALVPRKPFKPKLGKNLRVALAIGLIVGILLAFLFEHLDDTLKTSQEVEERVRAPILGVVPFVSSPKLSASGSGHISLAAAKNPRSPFAEAARSLVTSLNFSTAEGAPKTIHVTSSSAGEGKTTVATNIAIAFARTGGKVLQIDADLRSPSLHHVHELPNDLGLTNYLAGNTKPADIAQPTQIVGLFTITSGPLPPNPMELLASAKMFDLMSLVAERFDFVIIDGPPVIGLADAIVLSKLARSTIFVTAIGHTRHGTLEGAVKRLQTANANIIGAVVNRFDHAGGRYGYGYGYDYHYTYDYGVRDQAAKLPEQA